MKSKKVISVLLSLMMVAVLIPLTAIPALAEDEYTEFTIAGWGYNGPPGSVASVKINGTVLPEEGGTIKADPEETVTVEIVMNRGFSLTKYDGVYLEFLGGEYYESLSSSDNPGQIKLPDAGCFTLDNPIDEVYLSFSTRASIADLTVAPVLCDTSIEVIDQVQKTRPEVGIPEDTPYRIENLFWLDPPQGAYSSPFDFTPINETTTLKGRDAAYIGVTLGPTREGPGVFDASVGATINVNGGEALVYNIDSDGYLMAVLKVDLTHVPGAAKTENVVAPECEKAGSHDEVVYCEKCGAKISSKTVTDPALGHKWGAWKVVKQPTATETGLKQRVCKHDPSHVQTKEIPATGENGNKKNDDPSNNIPKTGDTNPLGFWIVLLAFSLLALSGYGFHRIRSAGKKSE